MTAKEFDLLATLLAHPNVVLSRDRLLDMAAASVEFVEPIKPVIDPLILYSDRARRVLYLAQSEAGSQGIPGTSVSSSSRIGSKIIAHPRALVAASGFEAMTRSHTATR